jgi:hypothetical protein
VRFIVERVKVFKQSDTSTKMFLENAVKTVQNVIAHGTTGGAWWMIYHINKNMTD